jgi:hypothetical protein
MRFLVMPLFTSFCFVAEFRPVPYGQALRSICIAFVWEQARLLVCACDVLRTAPTLRFWPLCCWGFALLLSRAKVVGAQHCPRADAVGHRGASRFGSGSTPLILNDKRTARDA